MKIRRLFTVMFAIALTSGALLAQPAGRGRGNGMANGMGPGCAPGRMYDLTTVQTLSGTVVSVERLSATRGMGARIDLMLQTAQQTLRVILGPDWYIDRLPSAIAKGDVIDVKGSFVSIAGQETLIAAEVRNGSNTIVLRDANGVPLWAGLR